MPERELNALDALFLRDVERAGHALPMIFALMHGRLDPARTQAALNEVAALVPLVGARLSGDGKRWVIPAAGEAAFPLDTLERAGPLDDAAVGAELQRLAEEPCDPRAPGQFRVRLVHGPDRTLFVLRGLHAVGDGMVLAYLADACMRRLGDEPRDPGQPPGMLSDQELVRRLFPRRALWPVAFAKAAFHELLPRRADRALAPVRAAAERDGRPWFAFGRIEPAVVAALDAATAGAGLPTAAAHVALSARAVAKALVPEGRLGFSFSTRFFLRERFPLGNHFTILQGGAVGPGDSLAHLSRRIAASGERRLEIIGRYIATMVIGRTLRRGQPPPHEGVYVGGAAQYPFRGTPATVAGHPVLAYGAGLAPNRGEGGTNVFLIQDRYSERIGVCASLRASDERGQARAQAAVLAIEAAFAGAVTELSLAPGAA